MWGHDEGMAYIKTRLHLHLKNLDLPDESLDLCSPVDQWARPTKYAVMKEGRKSALRVFDDHVKAATHKSNLDDKKIYIDKREGEKIKCERFCKAKDFCHQYKKERENG